MLIWGFLRGFITLVGKKHCEAHTNILCLVTKSCTYYYCRTPVHKTVTIKFYCQWNLELVPCISSVKFVLLARAPTIVIFLNKIELKKNNTKNLFLYILLQIRKTGCYILAIQRRFRHKSDKIFPSKWKCLLKHLIYFMFLSGKSGARFNCHFTSTIKFDNISGLYVPFQGSIIFLIYNITTET